GGAFLDGAVGTEQHDADIVGLEIERHALDATRELDELAGLYVVEAVDAGDAVTDRQHLADLGNLGLLAEILDLVLEDRRDFRGFDIHYPTSFMATRIAVSFVLSEESIIRLPTLTIRPPISEASTCSVSDTVLPIFCFSVAASVVRCVSLSGTAEVTSAVTSPRAAAARARKLWMIVGRTNRRPLRATTRTKLATVGWTSARCRIASAAAALSSALITGDR